MSVTRADREASLKKRYAGRVAQPHRKGEEWEEDRGLPEAEDAQRAQERP